jgi:uncharacterized protein (UPF0332 family)
MSFDWSNYLDLARELHRQGSTHSSKEAELRSAISRAYYAAFCKSRNYLQERRHVALSSGADVHKEVYERFSNSQDKNLRAIGVDLKRLRGFRNKADYDNTFGGLHNASELCVGLADDTITNLNRL